MDKEIRWPPGSPRNPDVYPDQQIRAVKSTVDKFEEERQI